MTVALIGGRSGLGEKIAQHFDGCAVLSRPTYDISTVEGRAAICDEVDRLSSDIVVLNSFDHNHRRSQFDTFVSLWDRFSSRPITIVVISSFAKNYAGIDVGDAGFQAYCLAKKRLSEQALRSAYSSSAAKVVVIEPCVVENNAGKNFVDGTYITYDELLDMIDCGLDQVKNCRATCISRVGLHSDASLLQVRT